MCDIAADPRRRGAWPRACRAVRGTPVPAGACACVSRVVANRTEVLRFSTATRYIEEPISHVNHPQPVIMQLVSLFFCLVGGASAALPHHHPQHSAPKELLQRIAKSNPSSLRGGEPDHIPAGSPGRRPFTTGMRVTPRSMGADPTGQKDSWAPLNAAIELCLNQSALSPNGFLPGEDTTPQFGPIRDAGGCDVDLGALPLFFARSHAEKMAYCCG
jgi:hypothetical protein